MGSSVFNEGYPGDEGARSRNKTIMGAILKAEYMEDGPHSDTNGQLCWGGGTQEAGCIIHDQYLTSQRGPGKFCQMIRFIGGN